MAVRAFHCNVCAGLVTDGASCSPSPSLCRRAFKSLAYKRFQHVPLYLEWAPLGVIRVSKHTAVVAQTHISCYMRRPMRSLPFHI